MRLKKLFKAGVLTLALAMCITALCSCGKQETKTDEAASQQPQKVLVTMENGGEFIIETAPQYAPETCANFINLVNDGFYNGLTFHRVIDNFVAQGGDPSGNGTGGSGKSIKGEFASNGFEQNTLSHTRGVVSMARRGGDMDSATSQFFICYDDVTSLDGEYAAFGKVIEGMEVVDEFLKITRDQNGMPETPIVIKEMKVME